MLAAGRDIPGLPSSRFNAATAGAGDYHEVVAGVTTPAELKRLVVEGGATDYCFVAGRNKATWMAWRLGAVYPVCAMTCDDEDPRDAILKLLSERGANKTICPSEAARAIGGEDWRDLMPTVHAAARALAEEGIVELRQGGERIGTEGIVGPYRIAELGTD